MQREVTLYILIQVFEDGPSFGEVLFFPEFSTAGNNPETICAALTRLARRAYANDPLVLLHRRHGGAPPSVFEASVEIPPPREIPFWTDALTLRFPCVHWTQTGDEVHVAYVPAIQIEAIARKRERLDEILAGEIRSCLSRMQAAKSLEALVKLQRCRELRVEHRTVRMRVRNPKEAVLERERDAKSTKPVISEVGADLTKQRLGEAHCIEPLVRRIANILTGSNPRSVLLVGPSGVGKTAAVHELVRRRAEFGLRERTFWSTTGSRLVAGMSGFGMWQERCRRFAREAAKARTIVHLGQLMELENVGRSEAVGEGLGVFLRPYLGRGEFLAIAECTPEQVPLLERENPQLLAVFTRVAVEEPSTEDGLEILFRSAIWSRPESGRCGMPEVDLAGRIAALRGRRGFSRSVPSRDEPAGDPIDLDALLTLDRLHRRFGTYSAYPGRPLRFLRNLLADHGPAKTIVESEVVDAFARETGLPLFMLDDSVPLDLSATRRYFEERVLGQTEAVDLLVDLLATTKAHLNRPGRPIASMLFIGPTGVGKTEMAKCLARHLFGDSRRLARFDMSEYSDPLAVRRLVGGVWGDEGRLTSKVREEPFGVLLLDEIEKAHPAVFDLLLQVLGDGRLTDAQGRLADFQCSVIIMTSNLGADTFGRAQPGFMEGESQRGNARAHFLEAVRSFVRPELFNRIDRIVPFLPLERETVHALARRELELIRSRDGFHNRSVELSVSDEAMDHLAGTGYDPLYGARPLKRVFARELLSPLADALNANPVDRSLLVSADVEGSAVRVDVEKVDQSRSAAGAPAIDLRSTREHAAHAVGLRREMQVLLASHAVQELANRIYELSRRKRRPRFSASDRTLLDSLMELQDKANRTYDAICAFEEHTVLAHCGGRPPDLELWSSRHALRSDMEALELELFASNDGDSSRLTLAVFCGNASLVQILAGDYLEVANARGYQVRVCTFKKGAGDDSGAVVKEIQPRGRVAGDMLAAADESLRGVALRIRGPFAFQRFRDERGPHVFRFSEKGQRKAVPCFVVASTQALESYTPPPALFRRARNRTAMANLRLNKRREYDLDNRTAHDTYVDRRFRWHGSRRHEALGQAIDASLRRAIQRYIAGEESSDERAPVKGAEEV